MNVSIEKKAAKRAHLNWKCLLSEKQMRIKIGAKVRALRNEYFMSQTELAKAVGYSSPVAIALVELGDRNCSASRLMRIAMLFDVPLSYFG